MHTINVRTKGRIDFIDITSKISELVKDVEEGIALIFVKHTTCAIFINENEAGLLEDLKNTLAEIIPENKDYRHNIIDANATAHLKSILLKPFCIIPIKGGKLCLGTWQKIFLAEFDGPREREVVVFIVKQ